MPEAVRHSAPARPSGSGSAQDAPEQVSYEMLQDLLRAERRSNKLSVVPGRFWPLVRGFLEAITADFRAEQAKDPFSRRVMLLTDQVKNARHAAESLWALRERKLAMLALAAPRDGKRPEGLTPDEAALYDRVLETLREARLEHFDGLLPHAPPAPLTGASPASAPPPAAPGVQMPITPLPSPALSAPLAPKPAGSGMQPGVQVVPADVGPGGAPVQLVTIRALGDIPPFVGPDMQTYLLKEGDLASVPPSIANLLVRRSKAAIVDA